MNPPDVLRFSSLALCVLPLVGVTDARASGGPRKAAGLAAYSLQRLETAPSAAPAGATLVLEVDGEPYLLDLERHSLRAPGFRVLEVRNGLAAEVPPPAIATYRGRVHDARGEAVDGSLVAASWSPDGWRTAVWLPGQGLVLAQPAGGLVAGSGPGEHVVYRAEDALPGEGLLCGVGDAQPGTGLDPRPDPVPLAALTGDEIAEVAFDTDVEFSELHGSDVGAVVRDIESVMNAVEVVYERDVDITFELTTIIVRTGSLDSDPYTRDEANLLLDQLRNTWLNRYRPVRRDLVHMMTGRALKGVAGIANLGVVCDRGMAFGLTAALSTPLMLHRVAVVAHELGHNWSAVHCDGAPTCILMCSGAGACNGFGLPNFGAPSAKRIKSFSSTLTCLAPEPDPLVVPFHETWPQDGIIDESRWIFREGGEVNDEAPGAPSPPYSLRLTATGTGPGKRDEVRTQVMDLTGLDDLSVSFFELPIGVEAGEELVVEVRDPLDVEWLELLRITADGAPAASFRFHSIPLAPSAYHQHFRLRLRVEVDSTDDRWYVDNVQVSSGTNLAQSEALLGQPLRTTSYGADPFEPVAFLIGFSGTGQGQTVLSGRLTLDVLPPVFVLDKVFSDGSGTASSTRDVPLDLGVQTLATQAVTLRGVCGIDSVKSGVLVQTTR